MDNFEKYIKQQLQQTPDVHPDMQMWDNLSSQIDKKKSRILPFPIWWLFPGLLIGANLVNLFQSDNRLNAKYFSIDRMKKDTVYVSKNVLIHDTIYFEKKIYVNRSTPVSSIIASAFQDNVSDDKENGPFVLNEKAVSDYKVNQYISSELDNKISLSIVNTQKKENNNAQTAELEMIQNDQNKNKENINFAHIDVVNSLLISNQKEDIPLPWIIRLKKHSSSNIGYILSPKAYFVGFGIGLSKILSNGNNFTFGPDINAEVKIAFSRNVFLWANFSKSVDYIRTNKMDPNSGIPFILPPSDDFSFILAESPLHGVNVDLGLDYYFMAKSSIQPFIGFGIGMRKEYDYELQYDFENKISGQVLSTERIIPHASTNFNILNAKAGLCFHLNKKINLEGNVFYKSAISASNLLSKKAIMPQVRLVYRIW